MDTKQPKETDPGLSRREFLRTVGAGAPTMSLVVGRASAIAGTAPEAEAAPEAQAAPEAEAAVETPEDESAAESDAATPEADAGDTADAEAPAAHKRARAPKKED